MEAALLGLFMVSACAFGTLLEAPGSPVRHAIGNPDLRRALMGLAMGLTAVALIYSPWGTRSGGHMNPAVTATFLRLRKVAPADAAWYSLAQIVGGALGVAISALILGKSLAEPPVRFVVTAPGMAGVAAAFAGEALLAFLLLIVVLLASNNAVWARWTGVLAGSMIALFIAFEAPISGMSLNPARTLASAIPAGHWADLWIYFTAPLLGMLLAAETYVRTRGIRAVFCAKLHHEHRTRCIFCEYHADSQPAPAAPAAVPEAVAS